MAWSVLAAAPASQQHEPTIEHLAARVLIEQGDAKGALALERSVLSTCGEEPTAAGCDFW